MPLVRRERDNVGNCKGAIGLVAYDAESKAFDALGPQMRQALNDAPIKVLAYPLLQECLAHGLDPCEPRIDAMAAANIRLGVRNVLLKDRTQHDAELGMRPMRPRKNARRR